MWLAEKVNVGDPAAEIVQAGLQGQAEIAKQALDLFASISGAEAGNLVLRRSRLMGGMWTAGLRPSSS